MTAEDGRAKAIQRYRILAGLLGLVGLGLLVSGSIAAATPDDSFGMPYFIGGFIVGILTLMASAVCTFIILKAPKANSDIGKKEIGCAITGQYILGMFTIMGCFMGCVMAGVGGISSSSTYDDDEDEDGTKKTLAIVILLGCIVALLITVFSMCVVCTYGSYFGVQMGRRRGQVVIMNMNSGGATTLTTANRTTFLTTPSANNEQISQLERQNRLLQQQLELQRQLQQQQQQQQPPQYSSGFYPPPSATYGFSDSAYPPTAPPPNYDDVK